MNNSFIFFYFLTYFLSLCKEEKGKVGKRCLVLKRIGKFAIVMNAHARTRAYAYVCVHIIKTLISK